MAIKYFYYSSEQLKFRRQMEGKMGRKFSVGHVIVNGVRKPFTEITSVPKSRYADAKLVAKGEESTIRYTLPIGK